MACLWSCRHRKAKINPQDTRSALHFRMPDKQQHLVTFWCSYGDLTPCSVLHHAGGSSRQEHDVHWNSEGTIFSCSHHRTPMQRWWFSMLKALIHRTVRGPESDCFWLTIHSYRHFVAVCEVGDGGGGWVDEGTLHCRFLCKMLSTAGKLVQHLLWEEALSV